MKNKILFCLFCMIFSLNLIKPCLIHADAFAIDPSSIGALGDLGMALLGGAQFDFTGSKYVIDDTSSLDAYQQAQLKAQDFCRDYCIKRGIPYTNFADPDLPVSTYDYFKTYYFDNSLRKAWDNYRKAETEQQRDDALVFELSNSIFASWSGFDEFWYKKYAAELAAGETILPDPNPDPDFSFINNISNMIAGPTDYFHNNYRFWSFNFPSCDIYCYPTIQNYSYISNSIQHVNTNYNGSNPYIYISQPITISLVTNSDDSITATYTNYSEVRNIDLWRLTNNDSNYLATLRTTNCFEPFWSSGSYLRFSNHTYNNDYCQTSFTGISAAINYIYQHYANINLFVDGYPWYIISSSAPANPVIPDFPDIIDPDEDLPAYDIIMPDTSTGSGYFDLTSVLDALTNAILGASDNDSSTSSVLTGSNVTVLDDAKEETTTKEVTYDDVTTSEISINENLPIIPLPPDVKDAFQGTSILAELIDGTQNVLPDDLVTVFWGIVCVIFIIGLIRVMHK